MISGRASAVFMEVLICSSKAGKAAKMNGSLGLSVDS